MKVDPQTRLFVTMLFFSVGLTLFVLSSFAAGSISLASRFTRAFKRHPVDA